MKAKEFITELFNPNRALPLKWTSLTQARAQLPDWQEPTKNS